MLSRNKHQIRKHFSACYFPVNLMRFLCRIVCQWQYTCQGIFVVIFQNGNILFMHSLNLLCNIFFIPTKCSFHQILWLPDGRHHRFPASVLDTVNKLFLHFLIWDTDSLCVKIICQIAQMNQQREYIVRTGKRCHVILEFIRIYRDVFPRNQSGGQFFYPILVHLDVFL